MNNYIVLLVEEGKKNHKALTFVTSIEDDKLRTSSDVVNARIFLLDKTKDVRRDIRKVLNNPDIDIRFINLGKTE